MKKILTTAFLVLSLIYVNAQEQLEETDTTPRKFYLGFSTGINQGTGVIGPTAEYQLVNNLTINAAAGLGSWGYKVTGGLKYYLRYPKSWAFSLGYSYSTGVNDVSIELDNVFIDGGGSTGKQEVVFDYLPARTVNISAVKYWLLGKQKKNRLHLEFGYAVATAPDRYRTMVTLTDDGKTLMKILQPGGLLLGVGFSFGL